MPPRTKEPKVRRKFTKEEDEVLLSLIEVYGTNQWKNVASGMFDRTARQCRERYTKYLDPKINKTPWSQEEEKLLLDLVDDYSHMWSVICKEFPGRTDMNCKSHYFKLTEQMKKPSKRKGHGKTICSNNDDRPVSRRKYICDKENCRSKNTTNDEEPMSLDEFIENISLSEKMIFSLFPLIDIGNTDLHLDETI